MTNLVKPWKPTHADVVHRLLDNLDKLGIKRRDYASEATVRIGPSVKGRLDLVVIGRPRIRGNERGNVLTLFEVKTEPYGLVPVVWLGIQQLDMYSLALDHPDMYVKGQENIDKLSHSLAYRQYLVIQKALWDEFENLSEDDRSRLETVLDDYYVGVITFDNKWIFKLDEYIGKPQERETHSGKPMRDKGKTVRKKKAEKK
jgi:hypothetical protein